MFIKFFIIIIILSFYTNSHANSVFLLRPNMHLVGTDESKICNFKSHWRIFRKNDIYIPYIQRECLTGKEKIKPRKYLIYIHGGPHSDIRIDKSAYVEFEAMIRGYTVIVPNYRGSATQKVQKTIFQSDIMIAVEQLKSLTYFFESKGNTILSGSSLGGYLAAVVCSSVCGKGIFISLPIWQSPHKHILSRYQQLKKRGKFLSHIDKFIQSPEIDRMTYKERIETKITMDNHMNKSLYGIYYYQDMLSFIEKTHTSKRIFMHADDQDDIVGKIPQSYLDEMDRLPNAENIHYLITDYLGHEDVFYEGGYYTRLNLLHGFDWVAGKTDKIDWLPDWLNNRPVNEIDAYLKRQKMKLFKAPKK
jgi:esterase/lipase